MTLIQVAVCDGCGVKDSGGTKVYWLNLDTESITEHAEHCNLHLCRMCLQRISRIEEMIGVGDIPKD